MVLKRFIYWLLIKSWRQTISEDSGKDSEMQLLVYMPANAYDYTDPNILGVVLHKFQDSTWNTLVDKMLLPRQL